MTHLPNKENTDMDAENVAGAARWVTGACLCDRVRFEVRTPVPDLFRCHCSLCRRQGGAAGNAATLVAADAFRWSSAEEAVTRWHKPSGFTSHFCGACGCPVPNPLGGGSWMWVPAGLLGDADGARVAVELAFASRAPWDDADVSATTVFDELPDLATLRALLRRDDRSG